MAKAEKDWEKRCARPPKKMGRRSHLEADKNAIVAIVRDNGGFSGSKVKPWTFSDWIKQASAFKGNGTRALPGATFKKNLKEVFSRNLIPMHLIPAKLVQSKSREARLEHWYAMALSEAIDAATRPGSKSFSVSLSMVDDIHRRLCAEHLWKAKRLPETQRHEWLLAKWNNTSCVPIQSRKSTATPTAPRKPKPR